MFSSTSSSIQRLKEKIDAQSDFDFDSSQNVSELLGSMNAFLSPSSNPTFSSPTISSQNDEDEHLLDFLNDSQIDLNFDSNFFQTTDSNFNYLSSTPPKIVTKNKNKYKSKRNIIKQNIKSNVNNSNKNSKYDLDLQENAMIKKLPYNSNVISDHANEYEEISNFIDTFNSRFNLKAVDLNDVLDMVEMMKSSQIIENAQLKMNSVKKQNNHYLNESFNQKFQTQQIKISQLQNERDDLQSKLSEAHNQISSLQNQISSLQNQINNMKNTNNSIMETNKAQQNDISNLHLSLKSVHEIVEQQIKDISNLSEQNTKLFDVMNKLETINQIYDNLYMSTTSQIQQLQQKLKRQENFTNQKQLDYSQPKNGNDYTDEFYSSMCSAVLMVDNCLPHDIVDQIHMIRDDSEKSPKDRLLLIIKSIVSSLTLYIENLNQKDKQFLQMKEQSKKYHRKCCDVLSMYEEELVFLQTLTHSTDLQSAVFSHKGISGPIMLNDNCKMELIRQCAILGGFVEETIGCISSEENFKENFECPEYIDPMNVFKLLQQSSMESKLLNILSRIDDSSDNLEIRELFDILAAQVYINEVLKNYSTELQVRISQNGRDILMLRQEIENNKKQDPKQAIDFNSSNISYDSSSVNDQKCKTLSKLVKKYQHREKRLKRFISKYVEMNDDSNIVDVITGMITQMIEQLQASQTLSLNSSQQLSNQQIEESKLRAEVEKLQTEAKELESKYFEEKNKSKQKEAEKHTNPKIDVRIETLSKEFQQQLDNFRVKLQEVQNQSQNWQNEVQKLNNILSQKDKHIEELNTENSSNKSSYEMSLSDVKARLDSSISTIKSLTQEIKQYEIVLEKAKKQRPKMMKEIERLHSENKSLTETLNQQNSLIKDEYESKIKSLSDEIEAKQSELSSLIAKNQQLSSDVATLSMEKKSFELKINTLEKRIDIEKQNIIAQFSAKSNASQVELSQQINNLKSQIYDAIEHLSQFITITSDDTKNDDQHSTDNLHSIVMKIENEFTRTRNIQKLYIEMLDDITQVQKLLSLGSSEKVASHVKEVLLIQESNQNLHNEIIRKAKQDKLEIDRLKKSLNKYESQCSSLKHWENWARRIYRVIHESDVQQLNNDELRLNLEEALLSSVSHKSTLLRIESLRAQKNILLKFDNSIIQSSKFVKPTLHSLIAILIFVRRSQIQAGCLPLPIHHQDYQPVSRKENVMPKITKSKTHKITRNREFS
ncbi:hypothetical protein TRFO_39299 [Tritrichomonas foetus]|uniref:Uncharacterized protein n=1 Tax=Tritrichomonas foetus TaxID=1144522 RepID=A0A1J4JA73_9EUKA|nr:hypothetical protein TRFO_39299 [Tritrichomonas foetus]|eukprot:OHS94531.1 hypothetical protein TRFO_39299 [Tritrichomonas foetus]